MNITPAIDLRDGRSVQLEGGDYARERRRDPDPLAVLERFAAAGFDRFHLVDLDAATGRGSNAAWLARLLLRTTAYGFAARVGGGVRSLADVETWFDLGATEVVVGSSAVRDAALRRRLAFTFPRKVVIALDVKQREVMVDGWRTGTGIDVRTLYAECARLPFAGALITAVHVEGRLAGPDVALYTELAASGDLPLIASGGVTTLRDAHALARAGCREAVVGLALHRDPLALPPFITTSMEPEIAA